jgi:drug/metabolite transporter (DMT)-like permease
MFSGFQVAFTYGSATLFSSWALKIVSYPTQLLAKSCKLVPIMLIGWLVHGRRYSVAEFVAVVLITAGVLGYSLSKELGESENADAGSSLFGLILLSSSLICDGFTGPKQEALKKHYQPTDMQLMSGTNLYASILLVPVILYLDSFGTVSRFAVQHPEIIYDLFMLCLCSTIGQFFVFLTSMSPSVIIYMDEVCLNWICRNLQSLVLMHCN